MQSLSLESLVFPNQKLLGTKTESNFTTAKNIASRETAMYVVYTSIIADLMTKVSIKLLLPIRKAKTFVKLNLKS